METLAVRGSQRCSDLHSVQRGTVWRPSPCAERNCMEAAAQSSLLLENVEILTGAPSAYVWRPSPDAELKFHQSAAESGQNRTQLVVSQHFVVEPKPFYAAAPVDFWDSPHLHLKFIPGLFLDQIHDCVLIVRI
jgi:hypothetical protein